MDVKDLIKDRRLALGLSMEEVGRKVGVSKQTIQKWESGKISNMKRSNVAALSKVLDIPISDLMGWTTDESLVPPAITEDVVVFPVIGEVAAGFEHIAVEDWTGDKIEVPRSMLRGRKKEDFFVLSVVGDSMYPLYLPGDKVLVLKQSTVNHPGDVGVIRYDGDKASLKKLEYAAGENWLRMVPINPLYPPQTITGADLERCEIIGIPTLLVREIK